MKKALTIGLAVAALTATLSLVTAGSFRGEQGAAADALPANEILTAVRAMGLNPTSEPLRRGPYYVLHAYDPRGVEVRVVADAQLGDILSITPSRALNSVYNPRYERGPRIIHVPRPGARASTQHRDEPAVTGHDDEQEIVPPPERKREKPRRKYHSDTSPPPPPSGSRRNVLSAPPPPAEGPTPIRQTPRYKANGEKFDPPDDAAAIQPLPRSEPSSN